MKDREKDNDSAPLKLQFGRFGWPDITLHSVANIAGVTRPEGEVSSYRANTLAPIDGQQASLQCGGGAFVDVFGRARTGDDGIASRKLSEFICKQPGKNFVDPAFITATAKTGNCVIMTISAEIIDNGDDVAFKAESWSPDGSPLGNVTFNWVCRAIVERDLGID